MPNWSHSPYSTETSTGTDFYVTIPYFAQEQWEKEQERRIEERQRAEELRKDRIKYPLFFLKEGIV